MDVKNECSQTKNYTHIITEILVAILSSFALVVRCTNNLSQGTIIRPNFFTGFKFCEFCVSKNYKIIYMVRTLFLTNSQILIPRKFCHIR